MSHLVIVGPTHDRSDFLHLRCSICGHDSVIGKDMLEGAICTSCYTIARLFPYLSGEEERINKLLERIEILEKYTLAAFFRRLSEWLKSLRTPKKSE